MLNDYTETIKARYTGIEGWVCGDENGKMLLGVAGGKKKREEKNFVPTYNTPANQNASISWQPPDSQLQNAQYEPLKITLIK